MAKPSIAILHYTSPPVVGGVETVIGAHGRLFAENGYPVKVVSGRGRELGPRISVKVIPKLRSLWDWNPKLQEELEEGSLTPRFTKVSEGIYRELSKELKGAEIVIIHNSLTMPFNLALSAALRRLIEGTSARKKFIAWCHDTSLSYPQYLKRDRFPWRLLSQRIPRVHYVAISPLRRRELSKLLKLPLKAITVIPDGIDPESFLSLSPKTIPIFKRFGLLQQELNLLYPARIVPRKNMELAIRILSFINKRRKAKLILTGAPDPHNKASLDYFRSLKRLIREERMERRVIFLSQHLEVDSHLLRDLYLLCDLLLFPSSSEGFGIPILESGLCHLPIACSRISPLKEIGGNDPLYLDLSEEPREMALKVINYMDSHLTLPLFKRVWKCYSWESIFNRSIKPLLKRR